MNKSRIFIVEDEIIVAADLELRLTHLGYEVAGMAASGEKAIAAISRVRPDLVLMDIRLQGEQDGIETAKILRTEQRLPVVFLTAYAENDTLQRAKLAEPFGYILKPFEDRELASIIEIALYKHQAEAEKARLAARLTETQKLEAVGLLAGGVAHDFNNMLQVILSNVDLLLAEAPAGSRMREELEDIRQCARRSANLTRQLQAFARQQTVSPEVLDLNATVEAQLSAMEQIIGDDISLTWLPASGLWRVNMDPAQVAQILTDLCHNARDAIAGAGRLTLVTENRTFDKVYCAAHPEIEAGDYVQLSFGDTGAGMSPETQARIFEPFFTTKTMGVGSGLGLATVYGIVKQNGGFITVRSELRQGTTFQICLPRHLSADSAAASSPPTPPAVPSALILLVEDEPAILRVSQRALEILGYRVLAAASATEARRLAAEHAGEIALLMTDVMMPEMNGKDLADRLLRDHPQLKCLFMSGYTGEVVAHHGVLTSGVNFIPKPFTMEMLGERVRAALHQ